jgi:hypothetical protein
MSSVTTARTDPWHCAACGAAADLAPLSAEIGLVRLAEEGAEGFRLGSAGIEQLIAPLLVACECGGRFEPGAGDGELVAAAFDPEALKPFAVRGAEVLAETPRLAELDGVWRARTMRATGREDELSGEQVQELRLEQRLNDLLIQIERAHRSGDEDAAEAAHARYVELATTYATRTIRERKPA